LKRIFPKNATISSGLRRRIMFRQDNLSLLPII
jgi:hypothetical protein